MTKIVDWPGAAEAMTDAAGRRKAGASPKRANLDAIEGVLGAMPRLESKAAARLWAPFYEAFRGRHQPVSARTPLPPDDAPTPPPPKHEPREPGSDG